MNSRENKNCPQHTAQRKKSSVLFLCLSDWFIDAIECYATIHCDKIKVEVPQDKHEIMEYLSQFTFSADSVHPYNLSRLNEDKLRDLYRANKKCNNYG